MDRLTQLQDAIDSMARMFTNSIHYVHERSSMASLNNDIPVAQQKVQADSPEVFQQNMQELATDLVKKAKEIDLLIEVLPGIKNTEEDQLRILAELEEENRLANQEYEDAVHELEMAREKISNALRTISNNQSQKFTEILVKDDQ